VRKIIGGFPGVAWKRVSALIFFVLLPVFAAAETASFTFQPGWNIVSFDFTSEEIFSKAGGFGVTIVGFSNGEYNFDAGGPAAGAGYWAYSTGEVVVSVDDAEPNSADFYDVALIEGWNLIGNPYDIPVLCSGFLIDGVSICESVIYEGGAYDFCNGLYGEKGVLEARKGYCVRVSQDSTLRIVPSEVEMTVEVAVDPVEGYLEGGEFSSEVECVLSGWPVEEVQLVEARCADTAGWLDVTATLDTTCVYEETGEFTPACRVNESITRSATAPVVVINRYPVAEITEPIEDLTVGCGTLLVFEGTGTDPDEGVLDGSALVWSSSIDGGIGQGAYLEIGSLNTGSHEIMLTVTDSGGLQASDSIKVTVTNNVPVAEISSPETGSSFSFGSSISFVGAGTDPEEGALSGDLLVWESDIDGLIGTGTLFETVALSGGEHVVTLTVTDSYGLWDAASISLTVTNTPPEVEITAPLDDETFSCGSVVSFEGTGTDAEEGVLSGDALQWVSDIDGLLGGGSSLDVDYLSVGAHLVTLTATDGCGAAASDSVIIEIANTPPVPFISSPEDGASEYYGTSVTFSGGANDAEEGELTGDSLVWSSDVDGWLGSGASAGVSTLSVGDHIITLTAVDSYGGTAQAGVTLHVLNNPPVVQIDSPEDGSEFTTNDVITFAGTATDIEDGTVSGGSLVWESDIDGSLGSGGTLDMVYLSQGNHTITLTATDSDGGTGSDSVTVSVESPPTSTKRIVIVEDLIQAGCSACAYYTPYLEDYMDNAGTDRALLVQFRWEVSSEWTTETQDRFHFYGCTSTPTVYGNGAYMFHGADSTGCSYYLDPLLDQTTPVFMTVVKTVNTGNVQASVTVSNHSTNAMSNFDVYAVVVEDRDVTGFQSVVRDVMPVEHEDYIGAWQEETYNFTSDSISNLGSYPVYVIAWIQSSIEREILQSAKN